LAFGSGGRIWRLTLETGKSEEVQAGLDAILFHFAWSPDGKSIALSAMQGGEPELWLMSDFLPLLQPKR
jgi:Tol biopolymer transport system component